MTSAPKRIRRLAPILAALMLVSAGTAAAVPGSTPGPFAKTQLERHYQHEDLLYGTQSTNSAAMARHFDHEDAIYAAGTAAARRASSPVAFASRGGLDNNDVLIGTGTALVVLLLGTAGVVTVGSSRSRGRLSVS